MNATLAKKRKYLSRKKRRRYRRFWAKVIEEHYNSLLCCARRKTDGDESRAQDLVQLVVARILRYCPKPSSIKKSTHHYLYRSLYHCWTESKPRAEEINLDTAVEQVVHFPALASDPEIQKNTERREIVNQVFDEMIVEYPELRLLLEMKLERCTMAEIDEALGRDPGFAQFLFRRFSNQARQRMTPRRSKPKANNRMPAA